MTKIKNEKESLEREVLLFFYNLWKSGYWNNTSLQNDQLKEALEAERKGMGRYMNQLQKKQLHSDLEYTGKKVMDSQYT